MSPPPRTARPTRQRIVSLVVGLALASGVVTACGGGGGDDPLQRAMAGEFTQRVGLSDDEAYCYAGELVEYYGAEEMQRFVDDPDTFEPSQPTDQAALLAALETCGIDPVQLQSGGGATVDLEPVEDPASTTSTTSAG